MDENIKQSYVEGLTSTLYDFNDCVAEQVIIRKSWGELVESDLSEVRFFVAFNPNIVTCALEHTLAAESAAIHSAKDEVYNILRRSDESGFIRRCVITWLVSPVMGPYGEC